MRRLVIAIVLGAAAVAGAQPKPCELESVWFDYDEAKLRPDAQESLKRSAACIGTRAGKVRIEGHTDEKKTPEYSMALGQRQAAAVKRYLVSLGVAEDRLITISYGRERPLCTEHTEACRAKNRRAELRFE